MQRFYQYSFLFFLFASIVFAQNRPDEIYQRHWLTSDSLFKVAPEFMPLPGAYQPQESALQLLRCYHEPVTVLIFFGSWCSDSKREVPHFLTTLQLADNKNISAHLFGLDRTKKDSTGWAEAFKIEKVPTFIFLRGEHNFTAPGYIASEHTAAELGRIVEAPAINLEQDWINALKHNAGWAREVEFEQMLAQLGFALAVFCAKY